MVVGENFIHSELGNLDIYETSSLEHQIPSFERDGNDLKHGQIGRWNRQI